MNDEFVWTDELVKEFMGLFATFFTPAEQNAKFNEFKYSKSIKPEWEIIAIKRTPNGSIYRVSHTATWKDDFGNCFFWSFNGINPFNTEKIIHSVKRLSDGEVFTVGETISYQYGNIFVAQIDKFEISCGNMIVMGNPLNFRTPLRQLKKVPQKEETFAIKLTMADFLKLREIIDREPK